MLDRTLKVLEFTKVKEQLIKHASSSLGKEKVENLFPTTSYEEAVEWQNITDEASTVLRLKGNVPLGGIFDVRPYAKRAKIGSILSPHELLNITSTLYASRQMKKFVQDLVEEELTIPFLEGYANRLFILLDLERKINFCIGESGEVLDGASDKLKSLRSQLKTLESRAREKLENMIRSTSTQKMLSDAIITIRNDRFVIPVKQEYRGAFGGMVHDQSASGATLFIEPQSVVDINNSLNETKFKEKQEVERILSELSQEVAVEADSILENIAVLAEIDFMFAKGAYSQKIKASKPKLNNSGYIKLLKARHPLIPKDEVVPNDVELGRDFTSIVITGPNTGGKTVTLKLVGLFTLMAQSGLQLPALDGSEMGIFKAVYADIGDEQSIEQSLSTFSSHMVNIVDILKKVDGDSLVLFDELGAGTDPQEGAALAISILDEVYRRGARVIATTHYPELKAYGYNRDGVVNASVEFNVETLSPTYKLLIGVPGRSNAFEISKRLGLNQSVIENAKNHISAESNQVENMIASLEENRRKAETDMEEAEHIRKDAEELHKELQRQIIEFNEKRDRMYEKAEQKAASSIEKAKQEAEEIIQDLRKMQKQQYASIKDHELIEARKRLEGATPQLTTNKKTTTQKSANKQKLHPGDEVNVLSLNQKGHLIDQVSKDEWQVQIGIMKMKVKEKNLEYISRPKPVETKPLATVRGIDSHVKLELDLRGERFEDALLRVEKYIDDALLAGYPRVSIIHGKGTGALRQGVQEYVKNHRSVKKARYGEASEGGTGVTIIEFK
ncbi:DNA mismatch repair protein MutS2 [Bacillus mesophilus]|uniref:Endonuclease MutS2 n=1 Tax=Bacillus mesophilus TaxID=1808955 RepID=A0A6M0Q6B9_9BACI|nr:endonuclease MutS2 [Bacillus mesophilus]MBM7660608.1 DNA mismatch repair protein MutS2 [Bacillus mesophilus]NEY71844.1 endonuclease MutS2 [Bacillus mesophilus]